MIHEQLMVLCQHQQFGINRRDDDTDLFFLTDGEEAVDIVVGRTTGNGYAPVGNDTSRSHSRTHVGREDLRIEGHLLQRALEYLHQHHPLACRSDQYIVQFTIYDFQLCPLKASIVACPSSEMSARFRTFWMVSQATVRSVFNDTWSTYQTSSLNFSVHEMALRP